MLPFLSLKYVYNHILCIIVQIANGLYNRLHKIKIGNLVALDILTQLTTIQLTHQVIWKNFYSREMSWSAISSKQTLWDWYRHLDTCSQIRSQMIMDDKTISIAASVPDSFYFYRLYKTHIEPDQIKWSFTSLSILHCILCISCTCNTSITFLNYGILHN